MRSSVMGALGLAAIWALAGCGGGGNDQSTPTAPAAPTAGTADAYVDWVDVWWLNGVENGAEIQTIPDTPGGDAYTVNFRPSVNAADTKGKGVAKGRTMTVTVEGKNKTLTMLTGKDSGIAALAARKRCIRVEPDHAYYCAT